MTMKNQRDLILKWEEDVQKVHASHKAKFAETKQYVEEVCLSNLKYFRLTP